MAQAKIIFLVPAAILFAGAPAIAADPDIFGQDLKYTANFGMGYSNGNYGTASNTDVTLGLTTLSVASGGFRLSASVPYMRISGRGLVVFDASGNPIVINRRTALPPDTRTGFGDLNLALSYTIPSVLLDDFEVRLTGVTKAPIASTRRRLSTGEADYGMSVDVSRQWGKWGPFLTVGYLVPGQPVGYTLNDNASVSVGSSYELSKNFVAIASYDFDSSDSPLVPAAHELFGSLSWVRGGGVTLTGYGSVGLSAGAPNVGAGLLISYGFK